MFDVTNEQLIQIAAVDAGLDPFAEYCTRGMWKAADYRVKPGELPILTVDLWCPRRRKDSSGELLSNNEKGELYSLFFQFKRCHLFSRAQVMDAAEAALEKEAKKVRKAQEKKFRHAVMSSGGIAPSQDYESLPDWCKRKNGLALDVAVGELSSAGYPVQDANGLFDMLQAFDTEKASAATPA